MIHSLTTEDEPFLWEMLCQAIYVPAGLPALSREVIDRPELAVYVQNWGREGDCGFLASAPATGQPVGAVWLRLIVGYGYVDDHTPELAMAVLPEYRGQGIGTQLLTHLFGSECGSSSVSLSVSEGNPAVNLYGRFGFAVIRKTAGSLTMKRI
jgi:ribosomal protein S18 acetylase RimI-like enzyme